MLLEDLAKELVPVTSELLGGRTLNVMNTSGIIIASTEKERIGTFHQGALEAVQTGRTVNITKEQVSRYAGAKEGCNMPLRLNGEIIGAVGIYGNPEEIAYLARMWEACFIRGSIPLRMRPPGWQSGGSGLRRRCRWPWFPLKTEAR